jgi:hypothetical protein
MTQAPAAPFMPKIKIKVTQNDSGLLRSRPLPYHSGRPAASAGSRSETFRSYHRDPIRKLRDAGITGTGLRALAVMSPETCRAIIDLIASAVRNRAVGSGSCS